jgi:hypothetical protein
VEAALGASAGASASEAADVVPATLLPSPAAAGGSGGDHAFHDDAPWHWHCPCPPRGSISHPQGTARGAIACKACSPAAAVRRRESPADPPDGRS